MLPHIYELTLYGSWTWMWTQKYRIIYEKKTEEIYDVGLGEDVLDMTLLYRMANGISL